MSFRHHLVPRLYWLPLLAIVGACAKAGFGEGYEQPIIADGGGDAGGATPTTTTTSGEGGSQPDCGGGMTLCGDSCVDLSNDPSNCGSCGNDCLLGETCVASACEPESSSSSTSASSTSSTSASSTSSTSASSSSGGTCDPLIPATECGAGSHCIPQTNAVPLCSGPVGPGGQYSACLSSDDCADIYECVSTGSYEWCMQWCSSDLDCPNWPTDMCSALNPKVYVGGQEWGACWDGLP